MKYSQELNICAKHLAWQLDMMGNKPTKPSPPPPPPKILNRGCIIELTRQSHIKKH